MFTDQLVLTLATPCHREDPAGPVLVGVAGVDLTVKDLLAAVEYFKEGEFSYAFVVDTEGTIAIIISNSIRTNCFVRVIMIYLADEYPQGMGSHSRA